MRSFEFKFSALSSLAFSSKTGAFKFLASFKFSSLLPKTLKPSQPTTMTKSLFAFSSSNLSINFKKNSFSFKFIKFFLSFSSGVILKISTFLNFVAIISCKYARFLSEKM